MSTNDMTSNTLTVEVPLVIPHDAPTVRVWDPEAPTDDIFPPSVSERLLTEWSEAEATTLLDAETELWWKGGY